MNDLFDQPPEKTNPPVSTEQMGIQVDPRLMAKALKKMQGLVKGNGLKTSDVSLSAAPEDTAVRLYRFKARTFLKLAPEYGTKTEAGRNTKGELMASQADFNHAIEQVVIDARTIPEKRKQIIDFMFARTDKGFGIKDQRIKFHFLTRDFVQHEKCITCKNTGRVGCGKCQGHGVTPCVNCHGRRQTVCPRCRGTTKIHTPKGLIPCQFCRADGKVNCPKCAGRGQTKCTICAASGALQCQPCAGSGWLSHMAHIETYAQIFFDFDRQNLPPLLINLIERNAGKLVEKNDIEVALTQGWVGQDKIARGDTPNQKNAETEPDDMIWLDYDAICPYGPITFILKNKTVAANMFGFQARLNDCPPFLDGMTKIGQQALIDASTGHGDVAEKIRKAAKYNLLRDILTQTIRLKHPIKTQQLMMSKYSAGIKDYTFTELIAAADLSVRHITRKPRAIGLLSGLALYAGVTIFYIMAGGRQMLTIPTIGLWTIDALWLPFGIMLGLMGVQILGRWAQNRALQGIVPDEVLKRALPKIGSTLWWAIGLSVLIFGGILMASWINNIAPEWVDYLIKH